MNSSKDSFISPRIKTVKERRDEDYSFSSFWKKTFKMFDRLLPCASNDMYNFLCMLVRLSPPLPSMPYHPSLSLTHFPTLQLLLVYYRVSGYLIALLNFQFWTLVDSQKKRKCRKCSATRSGFWEFKVTFKSKPLNGILPQIEMTIEGITLKNCISRVNSLFLLKFKFFQIPTL